MPSIGELVESLYEQQLAVCSQCDIGNQKSRCREDLEAYVLIDRQKRKSASRSFQDMSTSALLTKIQRQLVSAICSAQHFRLHARDALSKIGLRHQPLKESLTRVAVGNFPWRWKWWHVLTRIRARLQKSNTIYRVRTDIGKKGE